MIDLSKLSDGDIVRSKHTGASHIVVHSCNGDPVVVRATTLMNAVEWESVHVRALEKPAHRSVMRPWLTERCTMKQQTVLLLAMRGCDGAPKNDRSKKYVRSLRQSLLYSAHGAPKPGSFMHEGGAWTNFQISHFVDALDHYPLHWLTHFMHACAIIGYKHPNQIIATRWRGLYLAIVDALYLNVETEEDIDRRLADVDPEPEEKRVLSMSTHTSSDTPRPKKSSSLYDDDDDDDDEGAEG